MNTNRLRTFSVTAVILSASLAFPARSPAAPVLEGEPNNSLGTAQSIDGYFSLDFSGDIGDGSFFTNTSTTVPHVTITGSGNGTFDYYSFYFPGPGATSGKIIIDVDHRSASFDSEVGLWYSDGSFLGWNDDYDYRAGAGGSTADYIDMSFDALWSTYLTAPGTYIVGVARTGAGFAGGGGYESGFGEPISTDLYTLQISVENTPEPSAMALLGLGAVALVVRRRGRSDW